MNALLLLLSLTGCAAFSSLPADRLKMAFGYFKEERACFDESAGLGFFGDDMANSDVVVFMELAHNPSDDSRAYWEAAPHELIFEDAEGRCESMPLWKRLDQVLKSEPHVKATELVQVRMITTDDLEEPEEALLNVWYNPARLQPVARLGHKNRFNGAYAESVDWTPSNLDTCWSTDGDLSMDVVEQKCEAANPDFFPSSADEAEFRDGYGGSKAAVAASFKLLGSPTHETIAFVGVNLPSKYWKGKNHMAQRLMDDVSTKLGASSSFILGDINTRLDLSVWNDCTGDCLPDSSKYSERSELYKNLQDPPLSEDVDICGVLEDSKVCLLETTNCLMEPYAENEDADEAFAAYPDCAENNACKTCEDAADAGLDCRRNCLADLLGPAKREHTLQKWNEEDVLQTDDGKDYELLNSHYYFPSNKATTDGKYRMLTYKKMMDAEWNGLIEDGDVSGPNPCSFIDEMESGTASWGDCLLGEDNKILSKQDIVPINDPMVGKRGDAMWHATIGWLDGIGWSKSYGARVSGFHYINRDQFTEGDHAPFLAKAHLSY